MTYPLRVFIGYDPRQPLAYTVAAHSIATRASRPVSVTPLILAQLPLRRQGLTEFTFSRYLVPWLCGFKGQALFVDPDVVALGDVAELFDDLATGADVSVVMTQEAFEWPSLMLFECASCQILSPEWVGDAMNNPASLDWAQSVGALPPSWNVCMGYAEKVPEDARLLHFTQGIPCWPETLGLDGDDHWHAALSHAQHTVPWRDLMGPSIHAKPTLARFLKRKYGLDLS